MIDNINRNFRNTWRFTYNYIFVQTIIII